MTNYVFNGIDSGESTGTFVAGGLNPDFLYITYPRGFDTLNIRTDNLGNTIVESALGGTFLLKNVTLDQLSDANFGQVDGDVDIGNNGPNTLSGSIVVGMGGDDTLSGQYPGSDDFLAGNQGDDYIDGNGGMDRIRGGQGDDHIEDFGSGSIVYGDKGADRIYGGTVDDPDEEPGATIFGGSNDPNDPLDGGDEIYGTNGDDFIQGNGGEDSIEGGDGDDVIRGGKDDDQLGGGWGDDWIRGDKGDDWIHGWAGDDTLEGGEGDDGIEGGRGGDVMSGGSGENTFWFEWEGGMGQQSAIQNLSVENMSESVLDLPGTGFGPTQVDNNLDWITDLKLGEDDDSIDTLGFEDWDGDYVNIVHVENASAANLQDLIDIFLQNDSGTSYYEDAILIDVNGGALAGKSFLLVDAQASSSYEPEYLLQVTGYTGDLDASDIHGYV